MTPGDGITIGADIIALDAAHPRNIDHSVISIFTGVNSGLSGGGLITASRSLTLDINNLTVATPLGLDTIAFNDNDGDVIRKCTIDNLVAALNLNSADVGLGNVDNTSDVNKPVSTAQADADALRVLKSGDTMTGQLQLNYPSPTLRIVKGASGQDVRIVSMTGANTRWIMYLGDGAAESGNAGSDFRLQAYNDAGVISTPINIPRATGAVALLGTSTNDSAAAGYVGQYLSSTVLTGSAVALTSNAYSNLTSLSLTAGDWDVYVNATFDPAATTNIKTVLVTLHTVTAAPNQAPGFLNWSNWDQTTGIVIGSNYQNLMLGPTRISLASPTTYYANVLSQFSVSTMAVFGIMSARRVR